ncbi:hypothetical protein [Priestia megaterium]|uniref:hypothetical protein n=1 Tax=Priestia megaterium TaxID=1404 RepID=UPI000BFB8530|nr:hypothetical protein [Priestia megaterium]PGO60677.1 hypothetical protein CN981_09000 [Priestia megaterium]
MKELQFDSEIELLADFLKMDLDELQLWSDDSITINDDNSGHEYIVSPVKRKGFMEFLGFYAGHYIYKN